MLRAAALIAFADVGAQAAARVAATVDGGEVGPPALPHTAIPDGADEAPETE